MKDLKERKLKGHQVTVTLDYEYPHNMTSMWPVWNKCNLLIRSDSRLRHSHTKIIASLLSHANNHTRLCCPSYETIMEETNIRSKTTINRCLKELINWQILVKKKAPKGRANHYYFVILDKDLSDKVSTLESPTQFTFKDKQYTSERTLTNSNYINKYNKNNQNELKWISEEEEYEYLKKLAKEGKIIFGNQKIHLIERLKEEGLNPRFS